MKTGSTLFNREEEFVTFEGFKRTILTTKVPLRNKAGEIVGLVGICRIYRAETRRGGTPACQRCRRSRQPGQERLPGQYEP